jgi:hypothetical protein
MMPNDSFAGSYGTGNIRFFSSTELLGVCVAMVDKTRRNLVIASRALDPVVYGEAEFVDAVKRLVLARRGQVRIVVFNPESVIVDDHHRLVELAMRVTSAIDIRRPGPDFAEIIEAWMVADGTGWVHRKDAGRFEGRANFNDPRQSSMLAGRFESIWQTAERIPHFRRLML